MQISESLKSLTMRDPVNNLNTVLIVLSQLGYHISCISSTDLQESPFTCFFAFVFRMEKASVTVDIWWCTLQVSSQKREVGVPFDVRKENDTEAVTLETYQVKPPDGCW